MPPERISIFSKRLCTKHRLIFTHRHRFASSAQRFDKDRLRLFIKASLPARGVTINGDDRRFACTFAAPTAATSVSAAGPRAGSTRGRVLFYFFQSLFSTQLSFIKRGSSRYSSWTLLNECFICERRSGMRSARLSTIFWKNTRSPFSRRSWK